MQTPEPNSDPWMDPDDLDEDDEDFKDTVKEPMPEDPWQEVSDITDGDLALAAVDRDEPRQDEAWSKVDHEADAPGTSPGKPPVRLTAPDPLFLPRHKPNELLPSPRRTIPWRSVVSLEPLELEGLLCVAEPSAPHSELLVAAWEWAEELPGSSTLRLRLADDGPTLEVETVGPHELALACTLILDGQRIPVRLHVARNRSNRGVRLGRDILARRFLVDAADDRGNTDPPESE